MKRAHKLLACLCLLLASSCADSDYLDSNKHDVIDRPGQLTRQDYVDMHGLEAAREPEIPGMAPIAPNVMEPPIPDLAEILAAPKPPKIGETQLVSVAVTDDVPLKDVLIELARLADVDIEVDAGITGGIAFRAKDRPFNEVIERIADLAGLRYSMKNNVLRVERDTPYIQTYTVDMLNVDRNMTGNIGVTSSGSASMQAETSDSGSSSNSSSSSSSDQATSGVSATSGSSSNITAESRSDFWVKFEESLTRILAYQPSPLFSATSIALQPGAPAALPIDPNDPNAPPPAAAPAGAVPGAVPASFYSLNRQAGTLIVSGTERQHDTVKRFLTAITANASAQVLIEAKIVEVELNDRYQTGIDWTQFGTATFNFSGDLDIATPTVADLGVPSITVLKNNVLGGTDLSAAVSLLQEFGTTRALSSPRLNAINNQQAILSFVENVLYHDVRVEVTPAVPATDSSPFIPAQIEANSTPRYAPVGIVLTLLPSINKETNEVTLSVRPTLTKLVRFIPDPGFQLQLANAIANLDPDTSGEIIDTLLTTRKDDPQLEVRELDSILKIRSGQVMVIGGLLEDRVENSDAGVPGISEVPYFGNLFKNVEKINSKKELVIFIRATIIGSSGFADRADREIYRKFMQDPRPLEF